MFKIIKVDKIGDISDYDEGTFLMVGEPESVYVVYEHNNTKIPFNIPVELFKSLCRVYHNNIIVLKELAGKFSADDIIKFKTNDII